MSAIEPEIPPLIEEKPANGTQIADWMFQKLAPRATRMTLGEGEQLFRQGDLEDTTYLVFEGELDVFVTIGNKSTRVATLGPGEVVGEMATLCDAPRSATVVARTPAQLGALTRTVFESLLLGDPEAALAIIEKLAERVQSATSALACLTAAAFALETDEVDPSVLTSIRRKAKEIGPFAQAFERMVLEILAKRRHREDIEIAHAIQMTIRPRDLPQAPAPGRVAAHGLIRSPREFVTDFFDWYQVGDDHDVAVMASVSGTGVPAALLMAMTRTMLRAASITDADALRALERANQLLCVEHETGMYVSAFHALIHRRTGRMRYCNAGHCWPLIAGHANPEPRFLEGEDAIALGIMADGKFPVQERILAPQDRLVLYSRGILAATAQSGEIYGPERLKQQLSGCFGQDPAKISHRILSDVEQFAGADRQRDDYTCLTLAWGGPPAESSLPS